MKHIYLKKDERDETLTFIYEKVIGKTFKKLKINEQLIKKVETFDSLIKKYKKEIVLLKVVEVLDRIVIVNIIKA